MLAASSIFLVSTTASQKAIAYLKDFSLRHGSLEHKERTNVQAATSCVRHHKKRKRALNVKRQRMGGLVGPGSTLDRQKKNPEHPRAQSKPLEI
jgi:hypothetical protein